MRVLLETNVLIFESEVQVDRRQIGTEKEAAVASSSPAGGPPMYLIDFEYAGWGYRGYDIANHFNEYAGASVTRLHAQLAVAGRESKLL